MSGDQKQNVISKTVEQERIALEAALHNHPSEEEEKVVQSSASSEGEEEEGTGESSESETGECGDGNNGGGVT